ncbi:MAG: V-type ATP synthase subunit A, partial [Methanoculleaceae archaeon]
MAVDSGTIVQVAGPVVKAEGMTGVRMYEVVRVGDDELIGEVIELEGDIATIQVYEETTGLKPGMRVKGTDMPLSVELGPGLLGTIYDGIQRPLELIREESGEYIERGVMVPPLSREKRWLFTPEVVEGSAVGPGDVLGTVEETAVLIHRILVPPGVGGIVTKIAGEGQYTIEDEIARIEKGSAVHSVTMLQRWPVREARPFRERMVPEVPLITGQRSIDTFFPVAKGGTVAIPGPFGSGKTVVQQTLAKWADADIVVYIGCGERGNEMADVLTEFPELVDPRTERPLIERTVMIANTSNMPVAAREA